MVYKEKIQTLLESLQVKLKTIENISNGAVQLPPGEVNKLIRQINSITEQVATLVNAER